jgi:serine phosphatase RsbU (regulator of sigma subunit)
LPALKKHQSRYAFFVIINVFTMLQLSFFFYLLGPARAFYLTPFLFTAVLYVMTKRKLIFLSNLITLFFEIITLFSIHFIFLQNSDPFYDIAVVAIRFIAFLFFYYGSTLILKEKNFFLSLYQVASQQKIELESTNKNLEDKNDIIRNKNKQLLDELSLAQQIQIQLLPACIPEIPNIKLATLYKPMEEVGGDFYDFIHFDKNEQFGIFISDVSGHGVPAALITSMVKSILDASRDLIAAPEQLLTRINDKMMFRENGRYLTAFYGILETQTRKFTYIRAAHPYPYLIRDYEIIELKGKGMLLGMFDDLKFEVKQINLEPGDKIIFYTDGLIDAKSPSGEKFLRKLPGFIKENYLEPIDTMVQNIYYQLLDHCEEFNFDDDVCIIGMEVK